MDVKEILLLAALAVSVGLSWRGRDFELGHDSAIVPAKPGLLQRVRTLVGA
jgi:hypothetical protein